MSGDFLGTFENSVNKQRIIIPAPFKAKFSPAAKQSVIITLGPSKNIVIYPLDNWVELRNKLKTGTDRERELFIDLIEFACPEQKLEGPGRIKISELLLSIAEITDSVIIKGEGDHISIWNPEHLNEVRKKRLEFHSRNYTASDYQI